MSLEKIIVIGGGAAGLFAALAAKEKHPEKEVILLEKSATLLAKVRVSGGGRCNVTHACFNPQELIQNYPRGSRELLGPFYSFQPRDTIDWFESRGIQLKVEKDGRMFPVTDSSQTIIDCLVGEAKRLGVEFRFRQKVNQISRHESQLEIHLNEGQILTTQKLILATGSSREGYLWAESLGHTIQEPVPSLFTFNIPDFVLASLSGVSVERATVTLFDAQLSQTGPLLITHFGLSGPAVLKLSAWAARFLYTCDYKATVSINWLPELSEERLFSELRNAKEQHPEVALGKLNPFQLPKKLWQALLNESPEKKVLSFSDKQLRVVARTLHRSDYQIDGKTTHKEEFVTCGGITLKEVDFKTMQSKICPGLFFAGEILDIDGVTGGFNFQNAWTTGYIAGSHAANNNSSTA